MWQAIKSYFVPHSAGSVGYTGAGSQESVYVSAPFRPLGGQLTTEQRALRSRAGRTIFWAVVSERAFRWAVSSRGVLGALFGGSLVAGTAYVQERAAVRAQPASAGRAPGRSRLSYHVLMGVGLSLGAMLANRRRN